MTYLVLSLSLLWLMFFSEVCLLGEEHIHVRSYRSVYMHFLARAAPTFVHVVQLIFFVLTCKQMCWQNKDERAHGFKKSYLPACSCILHHIAWSCYAGEIIISQNIYCRVVLDFCWIPVHSHSTLCEFFFTFPSKIIAFDITTYVIFVPLIAHTMDCLLNMYLLAGALIAHNMDFLLNMYLLCRCILSVQSLISVITMLR